MTVLLATIGLFCCETGPAFAYLQVTVQYIGARNQTYVLYCYSTPSHNILQPCQARFLCRDSAETDKSMTISCSIVRMKGGGDPSPGSWQTREKLILFLAFFPVRSPWSQWANVDYNDVVCIAVVWIRRMFISLPGCPVFFSSKGWHVRRYFQRE